MRSKALVALGALLISVLASTSAFATTYTGYTLDASVGFTAGGAVGTIDPVSGPLNADFSVCLDGTCDITSQDWLAFTVTVTSGSVNDVGVGALFASSLGLGYFTGGGPVQDGSGLTDTYTGDSTSSPTVPTFTFVANGGGAGLTGTSLVLFATYADGALPSSFGPGNTQFMVTDFGTAGIDSPMTPVTTEIDIVPEPSTALLLGGGLLLLGARKRSRA